MKRRCVFSSAIVIILAALSVAAFAGSFSGSPLYEKSEERVMLETAADSQPETTAGQGQAVTEAAPAEKTIEMPYQPVAAGLDWSEEESYLLVKLAMAEAESEDTEGKALVMLVVLNRVCDEEFPDTVKEVIYQPGQFRTISNGRFDRVEPDADCWAALDLILHDKWDESCGATYYENGSGSTWHSRHLTFLFRHGRHYFYTDGEE